MMMMMMNCEINFSRKALTQSEWTTPHNNGKNDVNDEGKKWFRFYEIYYSHVKNEEVSMILVSKLSHTLCNWYRSLTDSFEVAVTFYHHAKSFSQSSR